MSATRVLATVLVGAWLAGVAAQAQTPTAPDAPLPAASGPAATGSHMGPAGSFLPPQAPSAPGAAVPEEVQGVPPGPAPGAWGPPCTWLPCAPVQACTGPLSDWITLHRGDCCVTPGKFQPIGVEVFVRNGVSVPVGGGLLGHELHPGWTIQAGGRSLFFDSGYTTAWTVEANIVNTYQGAMGQTQIPLSVLIPNPTSVTGLGADRVNFGTGGRPGVTIRALNRTMIGMGLGKEWYLWAPANAPGTKWRIGADFGGRYGSERMDFNEIRHRTRVLENMYYAAHTDYEWGCGRCNYLAGFRLEYDYTWSTILQTQHDLQDLNFLITLGVRY